LFFHQYRSLISIEDGDGATLFFYHKKLALNGGRRGEGWLLILLKHKLYFFSKGVVDVKLLPKVTVKNHHIEYSKFVKNLGIFFDDTLSWSKQVSCICQRVYLKLRHLYKFRAQTPEATRIHI
jgi:hypothetical protein